MLPVTAKTVKKLRNENENENENAPAPKIAEMPRKSTNIHRMHLPTSNDRKPLKRLLKRKFGRIPTWNKNKGPTPPNSRSQRKCWRIANPDSIMLADCKS